MNPELRAAVRTRDDFLAIVAMKLDAQVADLVASSASLDMAHPSAACLRESSLSLQGFARELRIIAEPRREVPMRRRRLDLGATIVRHLTAWHDHSPRARFSLDVTRGGSVVGRWDRDHLSTILGELLSNAVKYGGSEPVTLRLAARGDRARLIVNNRGEWVGPRNVYERFRRGDPRKEVRGFGVGLWLTRRLAEAHGGRLSFRSGGGETSAIVTLPFDEARGDLSRFSVTITSSDRSGTATAG